MAYKIKYIGRYIVVSAIILIASATIVSAIPPIPESYWGYATIDGAPAPTGAKITIEVYGTGEEVGNTTVQFPNGGYSLDLIFDDPDTQVDEGADEGDKLTWKINDINCSIPSPGTDIATSGATNSNFNLSQYTDTNLYLSKQAPVSKDRGSTMLYTLYYHNFGDTAAPNVVLNDTLPAEVEFVSASDGWSYDPITRNVTWNLGNIAPNGHGYENLTVRINQSVEIGTVIQNNARISTSNLEVRYDDNEAQAKTKVTGSNLPSNVSVEPNNGGTIPSVYFHTPINFSYHSCSTATGVNVTIHIDDGGPDITGSMTGGPPDWIYTTTFYPRHGQATVTYTAHGCNQGTVSFDIYIDPAGYIYDITTGLRIEGASVWLQYPDGQGGWVNVPTNQSPPVMQPDTNPQITGSDGQYQWDVLAGSYRVHVEASGYYPADSIAVSIPPPVTDLHVGLTRIPDNITGQITYSNNGTGISGVFVNLTNSSGITVSTTSNASGFYRFFGIGAGNYNINASKPGFFKNSTSITLNAGQTKEVDLMLWLKGDLNNDGSKARVGDVVLMLRANTGEITSDFRFDLNNDGSKARVGDVVLMLRANTGEIILI